MDPDSTPVRHYHWAICWAATGGLRAQEFWSPEIWTTKRFLAERSLGGRCLEP